MLPARFRLRRNAEIRQVRRDGRMWRHPLLLLFVRSNDREVSRFAISVSARVGKAVVRNRCRRRVREVLRHSLSRVQGGWDCLFVARNPLATASYSEIEAAVLELLKRAGLLTMLS